MLFWKKNDIIVIKNRGGMLGFVISFFRDFLSGPVYIIVVVISVIGIIACIGYLVDVTYKQKEEQKKYEQMYAQVHLIPTDDTTGFSMITNAETALSTAQLNQIGDASATNLAQTTTNSNQIESIEKDSISDEKLDMANTPVQK